MRSSLIILLVCYVFPLNIFALNSHFSEWKLRILVEKANIRYEPDLMSSVVTTVAKETILESFEKQGEWFKVIIKSDKDGFVSIGYILSNDVEIISEKLSQETDFWEVEPEQFQGIGIRVRLTGGLGYFFGGDIGRGNTGMYDQNSDFLLSQGFFLEGNLKSFHIGSEFTGDLIIDITPKLGIGFGSGNIDAKKTTILTFYKEALIYKLEQLTFVSEINVIPLRIGLFYSIPIHRLFNISLNAGTGIYLADYNYSMGSTWENINVIGHVAKATGLGFHGGIGLELNLHRRAVFFIETQGRHVKISNFKGTETITEWGELIYAGRRDFTQTVEEGSLYYLKDNGYPDLVISKGIPTGFNSVEKAVFDFSGFSIRAGLKIRF